MAGYDKLTPEGKKFYAEIKNLKDNEVFVGFQSGHDTHKDEETGREVDMAEIAIYNELGTSTSPPRPFLRQSFDDNQAKIIAMCEQQTKEIAKGGTAENSLKNLGVFGVGLVQEKIVSGNFTPNAPSTIKAKGSERPLIDTGQMRQSVHYVIRKKGGS